MDKKLKKYIERYDQIQNCVSYEYTIDEVLAIANIPRKTLDNMFNLRTGLTFKTYATLTEVSTR